MALIRERFAVEVAWLEHLAGLPELSELQPLSDHDRKALEQWVEGFGQAEAAAVKRIEAVTNHDVKAVEYYLKTAAHRGPRLASGTHRARPLRRHLRGREQPRLRADGAGRPCGRPGCPPHPH